MSPVCTLMIGRLDDWMKAVCERDDIVVDPGRAELGGHRRFQEGVRIFPERGYRPACSRPPTATISTGPS